MKKTVFLVGIMLTIALFVFHQSADAGAAKVMITLSASNPKPALPGLPVEVEIEVSNIGMVAMSDLSLVLKEKFPFFVEKEAEGKTEFGAINPGKAVSRTIRLYVDDKALAGTNYLRFGVFDPAFGERSVEFKIAVKIAQDYGVQAKTIE